MNQVVLQSLNVASLLVILTACGGEKSNTAANTEAPIKETASTAADIPPALFAKTPSPDAMPVSAARQSAKVGEEIALTGYIGGREEPFTEGRAMFLLADAKDAPACTDGCTTPWDACCVAAEDVAKNSATIQVVDAEGRALKSSLKGHNGLQPGSTVTVRGKVAQKDDAVLVVNAESIHIGM